MFFLRKITITVISIHALLAESDSKRFPPMCIISHFYPRSPCGERLSYPSRDFLPTFHFYPRSPCGERHSSSSGMSSNQSFLSTLSLRRATFGVESTHYSSRISIHALLAESDVTRGQNTAPWLTFLSTLSLRRATAKVHKTVGHFCAYETNFMGIASSC